MGLGLIAVVVRCILKNIKSATAVTTKIKLLPNMFATGESIRVLNETFIDTIILIMLLIKPEVF